MNPIVKFIKESNGNVSLLKIEDDSIVTSFSPTQNVVRDLSHPNKFKIQSETSFESSPFVLDYWEIDGSACEPMINSSSFDGFLKELSEKFFFVNTGDGQGEGQVQEVHVNNFPPVPSFFKVYESPQYRGNVYGFTSSNQSKKYIVQSVFQLSSTSQINFWSPNHFDNEYGFGTMMTDSAESRLIPSIDTFQMNGMFIKITSTFNFFGGRYHLLRLYQDVRTNEVYLMANQSTAIGTYIPFDFSTLKAVDGGFLIECLSLNLKIEVRNKFF
ncbi:hypothetical protein [Flavobacterium aestivum]|uniref:hypothetical protein n=1 Tax=Flavobacterium aestivum TaxID=3003257 RepID=UPI0022854F9A|nr:hypothetical protein [Flavobacterium aestivum]